MNFYSEAHGSNPGLSKCFKMNNQLCIHSNFLPLIKFIIQNFNQFFQKKNQCVNAEFVITQSKVDEAYNYHFPSSGINFKTKKKGLG